MATPLLVVDDNAATRYSTSRILKAAGYEVVSATSGQEALDAARQAMPQLVVLDINLPDMDGFTVCRELRARPETQRTPIIYLSATFVDDQDKIHGIDVGADGYLTHPVEAPVLVSTVSALLRARRAEDAVALSEARFKAVFENVVNGIALLSDELVFVDANPAMARFLGRDRDAITGRHISAFISKDRQVDIAAIAEALRGTGEWRGVAPVLHVNGTHVDLEWSVSRTEPHVGLAIVTDITARQALEAAREQTLVSERQARAAAEDANRLKDEFLATLSHELRTPLNAIVGFSRVLQKSPTVAADAQARAGIDAIERNAWVQAQLITDLLDISRITAGKLDLHPQEMSAADAVAAAIASIQTAARAKQVTISVDVDPDIGPVRWDPSRFQQVVWNLVDNAVKFSPVGGTVDVSLRASRTSVDLSVTDHGRGISAEFLPHVFDRFRQQDSTPRRGHGGLGLGLAIVHQLVSAHGGTIVAASGGEGHGSTFVVRLPRDCMSGPRNHEMPDAGPADADLRGRRILIVDDNEDARVLLRTILTEASARVVDVSSVSGAMAALADFAPHVLVSDLAMPDEDGFDLIRQVREAGWDESHLPAIALSAYAREDDRARSVAAGYQAHFGKPLNPTAFLATVDALARAAGPATPET
jgi:PAS domain S-box-containing protein